MIIRSANAFNINTVYLVGEKKLSTFGNQGTARTTNFINFSTLEDLREHCNERELDIIGIEIVENASSVWDMPFRRSSAFLMGNEGQGLSEKEKAI